MKYRDLKKERDDAIARAVEAERLSMKSEFERVTSEFETEKTRMVKQFSNDMHEAYGRGIREGRRRLASDVRALLNSQFLDDVDELVAGSNELLTKSSEEDFCERLYKSGAQRRREREET